MKNIRIFLLSALIAFAIPLYGQENNEPRNLSSEVLSKTDDKLVFGGYGQVDYAKQFAENRSINSTLNVSRIILSLGYSFNAKTSFFSEIEFENVKEVYVEQAFINHSFADWLSLRAGLMLVPMGIINEYHEPPSFNGVNRPMVDNIVVPTTWREIGIGFTGRFQEAAIKYQLYLMNGFSGYDGSKGLITGEKFLRDARQKGAKSIMTSPDLSARIDYYGIRGLKLGLSGYFGNSESALYKNLDLSNNTNVITADSSIVGITMIGLDARYNTGGLALRGEYIISLLSNTLQYNTFTGNNAGKQVNGFYAEIAYNFLHNSSSKFSLTPFFRYENYNTHSRVEEGIAKVDKYLVNEFVFGIGWKLAAGAVLKTDLQISKNASEPAARKILNAGLGVWF